VTDLPLSEGASEPSEAAQAGESPPGPRRWIISPGVDLAMLGIPALFTLLALQLENPREVPLWAFLFLVVAFDVAHVWATVYLSYLDTAALRRRRLLFLLPVPLTILVGFRLHLHSPILFWTLMAYVAIHHFVSQQWGFVALYKLRGQERGPLDRYLDKWTLYAGAFGPILLWHTYEHATFDWFGHGERFLFTLPPELRVDILAGMGAFAALYLARQAWQASQGRLNVGKNLWMLAAWVSWSLGVAMVDHPLVALACINLLHGIPFLVLVWWRLRGNWGGRSSVDRAGSPLVSWVAGSEPKDAADAARQSRWVRRFGLLALFYVPLLVLGLAEEGLWEGLVWGNYLPRFREFSHAQLSLIVAVLATPQIVHYFLDAWLWKLDGSNPDFERALKRL